MLAGDKTMIVWWTMKAGAHAARAQPSARADFLDAQGPHGFPPRRRAPQLRAGDVGVIPGGVEHEAWFPEDTEVIDVFAPRREEIASPAKSTPICGRARGSILPSPVRGGSARWRSRAPR